MLPSEVTLKRTRGDQTVRVVELGATQVPDHDGGSYAYRLGEHAKASWDGHSRETVPHHLATWEFPERSKRIAERCEQALEDGIPDQKRTMLRNQEFGTLEDRWITDLCMGEEIERPFNRWSKRARGETRVAICIDAAVACLQRAELLEARMSIAAGLAAALEGLDYECSILAACAQVGVTQGNWRKPREVPSGAQVFATVCKDENEPFVESGFAHIADTGLRRLMTCWTLQDNGFSTHLTDSEWRELTGADLFVFIGPKQGGYGIINTEGKPGEEPVGIVGEDCLTLKVDGLADIDPAIAQLECFFSVMCGE